MRTAPGSRVVVDAGGDFVLAIDTGNRTRSRPYRRSFVRGRWNTRDGVLRLASSPPPGWRVPECGGPPIATADETALAEFLRDAAHAFPGRVRMQFTVGRRRIRGRSVDSAAIDREEWVWALTGSAILDKAVVPLGRSGDGRRPPTEADLEELERLCRRVSAAAPLRPVTGPVVLGHQAAAVLLHELVGHIAEAPAPAGLSPLIRPGTTLAAPLLQVDDVPELDGGVVRYAADDDGIMVMGPTPVVRDGVLVTLLHSRASAATARTLPSANGRSASAWADPIPRMSNLFCHPGHDTLSSLVEGIDKGLFIHHLADGYGVGDSISARVVLAETIVGGRLSGCYLTGGQVNERHGLLRRLTGLGDRTLPNANSMCGKAGQLLADVGTWAPAMALSRLTIVP